MNRIKNLKYDPNHADKPMRGYSHLEYLDKVISLDQARRLVAHEKKMGYKPTVEIIEVSKKKKKKVEAPDLELDASKEKLNEADS